MTATADGNAGPSAWERLSNARFEIGGLDQLAELRSQAPTEPTEAEGQKRLEKGWRGLATKIQVQTGTLLKTDTVSLLLGAGASKSCGGVLIGRVPLEVERALLNEGFSGTTKPRMRRWLRCFYLAAARAGAAGIPTSRQEIVARRATVLSVDAPDELPVNYEALLSLLYRWRAAMPALGGRIRLGGAPGLDLASEDLDECLARATRALANRCRLPTSTADASGFLAYRHLVRKILTRPLNLKRVNVFTLNYDTLVEQAADGEGVVVMDGFVGTLRRVFRPESYDQDLYFPAETTEGRVHRLDRVVHLYKLHGSITWSTEPPDWSDPYGIRAGDAAVAQSGSGVLIYPTPAKFGETLGMPYAELFRRFADAVVRPQSVLFVLGYGFGDDHVNAIIRQALAVPSFSLVIVDPNPSSTFVQSLKEQRDRRIWILSGSTFGTFSGFVEHVLPDLRDEDVRLKVMATWRAISSPSPPSSPGAETNG